MMLSVENKGYQKLSVICLRRPEKGIGLSKLACYTNKAA